MKVIKKDRSGSEHTFMSGVLALTASTVIVKIIGLAYKIPLMSLLGADGMGYFNSAYEIYALLCGICTSGLPVAVSMLVSSSRERGEQSRAVGIFRTSHALLVTKGVLVSGGLAVLAAPVSRWVGNIDAYYCILAISPALLFACISGAVRGYFQGCRIMTPTAVSQLLEAVGKLFFGVVFAYLGVRMGLDITVCAAMAVLGVTVGGLISAVYIYTRRRGAAGEESTVSSHAGISKRYVPALLHISLPITLSSLLMGSSRLSDMALIMRRLADIGVSSAEANRIYGSYTTLALPIFGLVPAFIPPITENLIPRLSAAVDTGDREEQIAAVNNAVRLTVFLAIPASMGITVYSYEIISLLFRGQEQAVAISAPLLSALGGSVLLSCLISTAGAILQSYKRVMLPIISLGAGAVAKIVSGYILIGNASIGAMGAPLSTFFFNFVTLSLQTVFLWRVLPRGTSVIGQLPKPTLASAAAISLSYLAYGLAGGMSDSIVFTFGVALAVALVSYLALCCLLGVVSKNDLAVFSKKRRISIGRSIK